MRVPIGCTVTGSFWFSGGCPEKRKRSHTNAGMVMTEVLNVPDDIPQELLDKAECVVILPSVVKFGFMFGGELRWARNYDVPGR